MRTKAIASKQLGLRSKLWPKINEDHIWNRKIKSGFTTIPRTMPLFMEIMDSMSSGQPVSSVYFELWCRAFDEHIVTLNNKKEMAFHSGFTGQRAIQTWTSRIKILNKLGFINIVPGPHGDLSYALILNPYVVVKKHRKKKTPGISDPYYNALLPEPVILKQMTFRTLTIGGNSYEY